MELACGYRPKSEIGSNSDTTLLVINLPNSQILRVMSRSLFLAMVILALPSIGSILRGTPSSSLFDSESIGYFDSVSFDLLPLVFRDLADQGLLNKGDKTLIVTSGFEDFMDCSEFLNENVIDFAIESDLDSQSLIPNDTFDFVLTLNSREFKFADRVLKIGGIVVMQLGDDFSSDFQQQSLNYKIVYLRRFNSTVIAMRKIGLARYSVSYPICDTQVEVKKAALKGLEEVLFEPPLAKSSEYLKKTNFLPDLLSDSLESCCRRILITDDNGGFLDWFYPNYPTGNRYFEVYNLDIKMVNEASLRRGIMMKKMTGISEWLTKNVREEDFVVMKAEAQVVEELVRERSICLVDELFLECKNQWWEGGGLGENEGKRAYWECLALYGRLRDEGVAVHQWWG